MDRIRAVQLVLQSRLVAILRMEDLTCAPELVRALLRGGIQAIEFTMTNADTPRLVSDLLLAVPEFRNSQAAIGIGSVRSVVEARLAIDSGAHFLVSPTCLEPVVRLAAQSGVAIFPGAFTPTEIAQAYDWGADIVKLFPARSLGPEFVRDLLAPMPHLKLMPTGGVGLNNMRSYFDAGAVAVGIGGMLLKQHWLEEQNWSSIEEAALEVVSAAKPTSHETVWTPR
jgi:2-dehydro-3-deoxyphosphogluconate aldolase / (4S)-4-hydroxy-2-oxoglutarate aldolase